MKRISEKKLEAFAVGTMGKRQLSKRELEEQKKKEDEEAAAHVFKEYVETFQDEVSPYTKTWVKAGTYDAGSRREDSREKGKLYKPKVKADDRGSTDKFADLSRSFSDGKSDSSAAKKKVQEKKKSNLELFKEELRRMQEEREERHRHKHMSGQMASQQQQQSKHHDNQSHQTSQPKQPASERHHQSGSNSEPQNQSSSESKEAGSFDSGDPTTTNLYLGNLSPNISEQQLMEIFGRYGPLGSIKIMWPRSEEEKQRGRNCGFVAYMSRKDAERALKVLNGRYVMGCELRLGWAKSVPILYKPIYVPPALLESTLPPSPSGLPFNAQPPQSEIHNLPNKHYKAYETQEEKETMLKILPKCVVKVIIPTEKNVLNVIHRMIEFVIRHGPLFEALIMTQELDNPLFSFLFENENPAHIYYRWKLFSLLQGDTPNEWSEKEFRMFKGGPIWKPPIANFYCQGMPDELVVDPDATENQKGALSTAQRDRLEDLIRNLTPERSKIGNAMIFCIEHADAADEICECLSESLAIPKTLPSKKIARLYLISDILHNCTVKVANASFFRKSVEKNLVDVFSSLHTFLNSIESRIKAEGFKTRVLNVLRIWEDWAVYPKDFLTKLRFLFLGKEYEDTKEEEEDIDGAPIANTEEDDEDLDGVPLDGAALLKGVLMRGLPEATIQKRDTPTRVQNDLVDDYDDDIDGIPLDEDIDGVPFEKVLKDSETKAKSGAFIPSKWETVDPEQIEAQAVTTSKWETLEHKQKHKLRKVANYSDDDSDSDSKEHYKHEDHRKRLREVEVQVMEYQDDLESGRSSLQLGYSITEQVEAYRRKLMQKESVYIDSPLSYLNNTRSNSPELLKRSKRSPSPLQRQGSSSRSSPVKTSRRHSRSRSPYSSNRSGSPMYLPTSMRREVSPASSCRSGKSLTKRHRSRSHSGSPKRYNERSHHSAKASRYVRSPSPSSNSHGRLVRRDDRDFLISSNGNYTTAGGHHRSSSHKHKHSHKH